MLTAFPAAAPFAAVCVEARIGTNVESDKVLHFLRTGLVESTYAVRAAQSDHADAYAKIYEAQPWGPRRLSFESTLACVRTAVYGTLDLPNAVLTGYRPYRLVYEPVVGESTPIVVPHNSASAAVFSLSALLITSTTFIS